MIKENNHLPNIKEIESDESQSADRLAIFKTLDKRFHEEGLITEEDGKQVFDLETLGQIKMKGSFLDNPVYRSTKKDLLLSRLDVVDFFRDKYGVAKKDNEGGELLMRQVKISLFSLCLKIPKKLRMGSSKMA